MKWSQLLSDHRAGREISGLSGSDLRSEFQKDYHRIIVSASFRRLQDKTQVFPLDKSDFIRTRLTHSLEVASIGRSLAENISESILEHGLDDEFTERTASRIISVIESAGLIHDIGNPPFGHFGEESIREWFGRHLPRLRYGKRSVLELLTPQQAADLYHFEGNAQGLRVLTKLHFSENGCGMNLTYGLLSAMVKYPNSSVGMRPGSDAVADRKMGFFEAETKIFNDIQRWTGTEGKRNPLVFILEAADDIAYATADIEDAVKKGFLDYPLLRQELRMRGIDVEFVESLESAYGRSLRKGERSDGEHAIKLWLLRVQDILILKATEQFVAGYRQLMAGQYAKPLLSGCREAKLLTALKRIAYDYAFTSQSIFKTEIAANNIINYLLGRLVPAALLYRAEVPQGLMEEKYLSLISENYRRVYERAVGGLPDDQCLYHRLLLATDTVAGMTDSYARDLYTDLNGIT